MEVVPAGQDAGAAGGQGRFAGEQALPKTSMVMVEFPGIVVNDAAALQTFGGAEGVSAALSTPGAMLPLRLRPEDTQSSAIFGDRVPTKNLVLRVVRKRGGGPGALVRAEVLARVPEAFTYKGMADFQFLDLANADRRREDALGGEQLDDDMNEDVGSLLDEQADVPLQLVPPIFSKNDKPAEYSFRDHGAVSFAKAKYTRKIRWGDAVPQGMSSRASEDTDLHGVMAKYRVTLERKFAQRPVWSGAALRGSLPPSQHSSLKALLFMCLPLPPSLPLAFSLSLSLSLSMYVCMYVCMYVYMPPHQARRGPTPASTAPAPTHPPSSASPSPPRPWGPYQQPLRLQRLRPQPRWRDSGMPCRR